MKGGCKEERGKEGRKEKNVLTHDIFITHTVHVHEQSRA